MENRIQEQLYERFKATEESYNLAFYGVRQLAANETIVNSLAIDKEKNIKSTLKQGKEILMELGIINNVPYLNISDSFNFASLNNAKEVMKEFINATRNILLNKAELGFHALENTSLINNNFIRNQINDFKRYINHNKDKLVEKLYTKHKGCYFDEKTGTLYNGKEGFKQLLEKNAKTLENSFKTFTKNKDLSK